VSGGLEVDARGLRCPLPVVRLAAFARELPAGTEVSVLATDPAARHDVPAWARMRGHASTGEELVEPTDGERWWRLTVLLGGRPGPGTTNAAGSPG
jgi:tRNA 2-thiouridine synthesizing protein A